jgi:hypothetical protein
MDEWYPIMLTAPCSIVLLDLLSNRERLSNFGVEQEPCQPDHNRVGEIRFEVSLMLPQGIISEYGHKFRCKQKSHISLTTMHIGIKHQFLICYSLLFMPSFGGMCSCSLKPTPGHIEIVTSAFDIPPSRNEG